LAIRHVSSRRDGRSQEATRVIRRKRNRRHMIGDHHGQTAGMAILLVRDVDGIRHAQYGRSLHWGRPGSIRSRR
jgi:hypothetical protein